MRVSAVQRFTNERAVCNPAMAGNEGRVRQGVRTTAARRECDSAIGCIDLLRRASRLVYAEGFDWRRDVANALLELCQHVNVVRAVSAPGLLGVVVACAAPGCATSRPAGFAASHSLSDIESTSNEEFVATQSGGADPSRDAARAPARSSEAREPAYGQDSARGTTPVVVPSAAPRAADSSTVAASGSMGQSDRGAPVALPTATSDDPAPGEGRLLDAVIAHSTFGANLGYVVDSSRDEALVVVNAAPFTHPLRIRCQRHVGTWIQDAAGQPLAWDELAHRHWQPAVIEVVQVYNMPGELEPCRRIEFLDEHTQSHRQLTQWLAGAD